MGIRKITPGEVAKIKQAAGVQKAPAKRTGTPAAAKKVNTNAPTVTIGPATTTTQPKVSIGTAYATSSIPVLVIQELTGDKRSVTLSGRAMPYKPMMFGVEHRIEVIATAGFSMTGQQPTGPQELDSSWKGAWKTRFLSDVEEKYAQVEGSSSEFIDGQEAISISSNGVYSAAELSLLFEDIARKGQLLRVQWLHHVRFGRLARFTGEWQTAHDVDWTMDFKWTGRDDGTPPATSAQSGLSAISAQLSSAYLGLEDATAMDGVDDLDPSIADRIDAGVGRIWVGVQDVEDTIAARVSSATDPVEALRRAMASMTSLRDEAELFIDELTGQVAAAYTLVEDNANLTTVTAGKVIAAACARQRSVRAARLVKHRAARQRYAAIKQLDANLLAVVMIKDEQDLRVLARIYYGNVEDWHIIREFNGFDSSVVATGTVVMIPLKEAA